MVKLSGGGDLKITSSTSFSRKECKMRLVNLTPHEIVVALDTQVITIPPSGTAARVCLEHRQVGMLNGIPVVVADVAGIEGLPGPQPGVVYLVSSFVLERCPERDDVLAPDTSPESAIRGDDGQIIAVRRLRKGARQ